MSTLRRTNSRLYPLAVLYGLGVKLRNSFYDKGFLSSYSYPIPVICVGNLAVGGTGKTPMVEYLLRTFSHRYRVAVVSRGYKRKSKGMILATVNSTADEIGDEPRQILDNFPHVTVTIDGNRKRGLDYLATLPKEERPQLIILDDGFQHRRVKPFFSILLTTYERPFFEDKLLPVGLLREPMKGRLRANCVVVTKCPDTITPMSKKLFERNLMLFSNQKAFFSGISICPAAPIFPESVDLEDSLPLLPFVSSDTPVALVAGIAAPEQFFASAKELFPEVVSTTAFSDHHHFSDDDLLLLENLILTSNSLRAEAVVTTQKDAVRLALLGDRLSPELKKSLFYLPIEIAFLGDGEKAFRRLVENAIVSFQT